MVILHWSVKEWVGSRTDLFIFTRVQWALSYRLVWVPCISLTFEKWLNITSICDTFNTHTRTYIRPNPYYKSAHLIYIIVGIDSDWQCISAQLGEGGRRSLGHTVGCRSTDYIPKGLLFRSYCIISQHRRVVLFQTSRRLSNLCYLICLRHLIVLRAVRNRIYFPEKNLFSFMLA